VILNEVDIDHLGLGRKLPNVEKTRENAVIL
jgi:hypothetical protein